MSISVTHLDDYAVEAYCAGAWIDLTDHIVGNITGKWGMANNKPTTRLADTGTFSFTLNNNDLLYSPASATAVPGWKKGVPIRLRVVFMGKSYIRFRGQVKDLTIKKDLGPLGNKQVAVNCVDWMDYAANYPLVNPGIYFYQRADMVMSLLVPNMPVQPQATDYDLSVNIFPAAFDTITTTTKAYTEFGKLAFSEPGYIYVKRDRLYGETLAFEGKNYRNGLRTLTQVFDVPESGFLLKSTNGGHILRAGDGGRIIQDHTNYTDAVFDNTMMSSDVTYGENVINRMTVTAYPKRISTSPEVLYSLSSPMMIGAGQTITFRGGYTDPTGGAIVNAKQDTMIAPTITTDYLLNTASDGSGTNISSDLVVGYDYSTAGVTYTLTNNNAATGWVILLQARGYGIFQYNPIDTTFDDAVSYNEYGYFNDVLLQQYQRTVDSGVVEAYKILELEKQPRTRLDGVHFNANSSYALMQAFCTLDVGDLTDITDDQNSIEEGWYYIQGVNFVIVPGKDAAVINFAWIVKQAWSLLMGLSLVGMQFAGGSATDGMDYGVIPEAINLPYATYSAWVKSSGNGVVIATSSDLAGDLFYVNGGALYFVRKFTGGQGIWKTADNILEIGVWHLISVTYDYSTFTAAVPKFYLDGVLKTTTTSLTPVGLIQSQTGVHTFVGNINSPTYPWTFGFQGAIFSPVIYNRILSASTLLGIYNNGITQPLTATTGLIFQADAIRTKDENYYFGKALTPETMLLDNIFGYVGIPHGSPKVIDKLDTATPTRNTVIVGNSASGVAANLHTVTVTNTVAAGTDRASFVLISKRAHGNVASVTRGNQNYAKYTIAYGTYGNYPRYEIWCLLSPRVNTDDTVVTLDGTDTDYMEVNVIDMKMVDQLFPFRFGSLMQTTVPLTISIPTSEGIGLVDIPSATGDIVIDILAIEKGAATTLTAGAGQTQRMNASSDTNWAGATSTVPGAASVTTAWTVSSAPHNFIYAAVSIQGSVIP